MRDLMPERRKATMFAKSLAGGDGVALNSMSHPIDVRITVPEPSDKLIKAAADLRDYLNAHREDLENFAKANPHRLVVRERP